MSDMPVVKYAGQIREIRFGKPGCELVIGGETAFSFYSFEGQNPHLPKLGLQVTDVAPTEWAPAAVEPFKDVIDDPIAWAGKCVDEYGADFVTLWLMGTDPNGQDLSPEHAAETARKIAEAIQVPLIVWGVSSDDKNRETLKAVCESCEGLNLAVGPITENNYKQIGAAAMAYKHVVIANSPIDINLAKQLNILLETLGMPDDRIIIDPTTSGVGYGMEYCYSIMERIRQAALCQNDDKLQYPILNNIAEEVWKVKEAKTAEEDDPKLGNAATRGINLEAITAVSVLQAGSDLVIMRHPKTLQHIRKYIAEMAAETDLETMGVDLSLVPKEPAAPPKPAAPVGPTTPPEEPKKPAVAAKPSTPEKPAAQARPGKPSKPVIAPPSPTEPVEKPAADREAAHLKSVPSPDKAAPTPAPDRELERDTPQVTPPDLKLVKPAPAARLQVGQSLDPDVQTFLDELRSKGAPETDIQGTVIAAALYGSIKLINDKVRFVESEGIPLDEMDFHDEEMKAYRGLQTVARAVGTIETKLHIARQDDIDLADVEFTEHDLASIRSATAVLHEINPMTEQPLERPAPLSEPGHELLLDQEAAAFVEEIRSKGASEEEIERAAIAAAVYRSIRMVEEKVRAAEAQGKPLDDIAFTEEEISSYRDVGALGSALNIIQAKLEIAEDTRSELEGLDFANEEIETLRCAVGSLRLHKPTLSRAVAQEALPEEAADHLSEMIEDADFSEEDLQALRQMIDLVRKGKRIVTIMSGLFERLIDD